MQRMLAFAALFTLLTVLQVAESEGVSEGVMAGASARMALMESMGLKQVQADVEKTLWQAQDASKNVDAQDDEIARLMAELDQLDETKDEAAIAAKKQELEAAQKESVRLKAVAAEKQAAAEAAVKSKAGEVTSVADAAQKSAEKMINEVKALRAKAAATMEEAKLASTEYQSALASGQTEGLAALEQTAKQTLKMAQDLSKEAGEKSENAKQALAYAEKLKKKATEAKGMETESMQELREAGLQWAAGPIFDKMKRLCEIDYPAFRKEYRVLRQSPVYAKYRWDIKKACHKAHNDDSLEANYKEEEVDPNAIPIDHSKPYPDMNTHWQLPKDKKVQKWCSTKFGAVPCSMLKKAQSEGLLASEALEADSLIQDDTGLDAAPELSEIIPLSDMGI
jgi:hypothetical protein